MPSPRQNTIAITVLTCFAAIAGCDGRDAAASQQATALEKLKVVLDAWMLGDNTEDPDVTFREVHTIDRTLMRYDVGPCRRIIDEKYEALFEVQVTLVFESRAGTEIKNVRKYKIYKYPDSKGWTISMWL